MRRAIIALCVLAAVACWAGQMSPRQLLMARHRAASTFDGVLWYKFATNVNPTPDSSEYGNDGTVNGATWTATGGGCYDFDGDDYIYVADADSLDVASITVNMWVRWDVTPGSGSAYYLLAKTEDIGNQDAYRGFIDDANKFNFLVRGPGIVSLATTSSGISTGAWHHIAATYNGSGTYKMYVDGSSVAFTGGGVTGPIYPTTSRLTWGSRYDSSESVYKFFFVGKMDEPTIWNRALTSNEVFTIYNNTKAAKGL